jgi:hypothetical protein
MGRHVTTTTLHAASSKTGSLRTTVPMWIINHFKLSAGDDVDWRFHVQDGRMVVVMQPVESESNDDATQ